MAFVPIEYAEHLYDVLESDSTFSGLIGSLEFEDGLQPALVVALASDPLEGIESASGLLVVIERDPQVVSQRLLTAQMVIDRMFTIRLIQFPSDTRNLRAATEVLMNIFPGSTSIPLAGPDLLAGDGQAVIRLPSNPVAHTDGQINLSIPNTTINAGGNQVEAFIDNPEEGDALLYDGTQWVNGGMQDGGDF